jgi:pimeloyl-ACP methyl ester carboxylesterase
MKVRRSKALPIPHIVFLHGFPLDGRMWDAQQRAFDIPNTAPTLYRLGNTMIEWASGVLALAPADRPLIVVGSSMGGPCALEMARQASDRIAAVLLVGSKADHRPEPDMRDRYIADLRRGGIRLVWSQMVHAFFGPSADPAVIAAAEAIAMQQNTDDLVRTTQVFHGRPDAIDVARSWQKPFVVIYGEEDGAVSRRKAAATANAAPHGQFYEMPGCGHFPNLDQPAAFNAILGEVVRKAMATART